VTFVGDARRKVMKDVLKGDGDESTGKTDRPLRTLGLIPNVFHRHVLQGVAGGEDPKQQVLSRTIPPAVVDHYLTKIASLEDSIKEMLEQER
jgi:hypothetical protein